MGNQLNKGNARIGEASAFRISFLSQVSFYSFLIVVIYYSYWWDGYQLRCAALSFVFRCTSCTVLLSLMGDYFDWASPVVGFQLCSRVFYRVFSATQKCTFLVRCWEVHMHFGGGWDPFPEKFFSQKSFMQRTHTITRFRWRRNFGGWGPLGRSTHFSFFRSGGVGDKHPHDSDHAECHSWGLFWFGVFVVSFVCRFIAACCKRMLKIDWLLLKLWQKIAWLTFCNIFHGPKLG